ncbi:EndoU domain-containing protein [Pyxidicoccus fallax]|uniref:EndoU domain-containing protein n=1 Tax=Pyxidicoccus fallax TaxID=394095 RepID=A0A848LJP3_9BACT|nr:EndoU domain-containing protein [Pyxidicoccus fallax]NMO17930.1 EndoU domain-containing protein [Pyxidicoccus fallax]NPC80047.1 EndoU domain-containing protein [Pyxidicoccus fallax]
MRNALPFLVLSLATALPALAGPGAFVSEVRVDAVEQPESTRVVFTVEPDTSYPLLKKGGPNRAWCKLQGPTNAQGWVLCEGAPESAAPRAPDSAALAAADRANTEMQKRGRAEQQARIAGASDEEASEERAPSRGTTAKADWAPATGCATTCDTKPLFGKPPALSAQDREVLDMCPARPDVSVSAGDVQRFFSRHYNDPRIQTALSVAGRPGARQGNIEWLTGLWVSTGPRNAFTHVFCGDDWQRGPIGGLHFLPRYAQLEAEGKLCYGGPARGGSAQKGDQYLIKFRGVAPWSCGEKKMGGFSRSPDAVGLVAIGTRAFARCCARGGAKKEGGVYSAPDLGGTNWRIWCGTRNGTYGIATLHPTDEKATCGD